jgi:hypothetical protein
VVGEPYFEVLEGWPVQESLNFLYTIRMLKRINCVDSEAKCVPARARFLACGIQCQDLGNAHRTRDVYGGFDHRVITKYSQLGEYTISIPLYEYNYKPVTETVVIAELDFEKALETRKNDTIKASFLTDDVSAHAIMYWVEYYISDNEVLSTGQSRSYKQEVCILRQPVSSKEDATVCIDPKVVFG